MSASSMSQLASAVERLQRPSHRQRLALAVPSLTSVAAIGWAALAAFGRPQDALGWSLLILFLLAMTGPVFTSWRYLTGFIALRIRGSSALEIQPRGMMLSATGSSRTAVLIAIQEDDPIAVFAGIRVMARSLRREGGDGSSIALFVLSATREGAVSAVEEHEFNRIQAWARIEGPSLPRIRYQREPHAQGGKADLIGAFCAGRGQDYDFVIPLASDSLMTGAALRRLVRLMESDPRIGLVQTVPYTVGGDTLLARLRTFTMRLDAPLGFRGCDARGPNGVWGHNAVLRLAAITQDARGGQWETRHLPELEGNWRVIPASGEFRPSRHKPATGLLGVDGRYGLTRLLPNLSPPIWFAFLVLGILQAHRSGDLGLSGAALTFLKPAGWVLLGLAATALVLPVLLSLIDALTDPKRRTAFGGAASLLASAGLALLAWTLLWPVKVLCETESLLATVKGQAARRDPWIHEERRPSWRQACRLQSSAVAAGFALAAVLAAAGEPVLALWMAPIALALIASPATLMLSRSALGLRAKLHGLFLTQDDTRPALELAEFDRFRLPAKVARSRTAQKARLRAKITAAGAKRTRPQLPAGPAAGPALAP